jgi:hypothetical protein
MPGPNLQLIRDSFTVRVTFNGVTVGDGSSVNVALGGTTGVIVAVGWGVVVAQAARKAETSPVSRTRRFMFPPWKSTVCLL